MDVIDIEICEGDGARGNQVAVFCDRASLVAAGDYRCIIDVGNDNVDNIGGSGESSGAPNSIDNLEVNGDVFKGEIGAFGNIIATGE